MNKREKIKVLFLPLWYPHKYDTMAGLFIERHAQAVSYFCNPYVLYVHPDPNLKKLRYNLEVSVENNIPTVRVYYKKVNIKLPIICGIIKVFRYLKSNYLGLKFIWRKYGKPDLVHVNVLTRAGVIALLLKYLYGIPYIITEHWSRYLPTDNTYRGLFRKKITKIVVKKSSAVTTVTENLKNAMLLHNLKNKNYFIVPNTVDTDRFNITDKEDREKKKIAHISCFDERAKNISGILRTIKKLNLMRQDFEFHLIGDGPDFLVIKQYADGLGILNKFVFFDGLKVDNDMVASINTSAFTVLFSNYETQAVVIIESFACGVPVVATAVGGIPEILTDEYGLLVKPQDEEDLLKKINFMLDNFHRYNSQKLREYAIKNFSYQVVGERFFNLYKKILE